MRDRVGSTVTSSVPRSFADDLRARSDDDLAALLRLRPDLSRPVPASITALAERASSRPSLQRAVDMLSTGDRAVMEAFALQSEPMDEEGVAALFGLPADAVTDAVQRLWSRGLLWGTTAGMQVINESRAILGPWVAGLGPPAERTLRQLGPHYVRRLVTSLGAEPQGVDPDIGLVVAQLSDPARVAELLEQVGPEGRTTVERLSSTTPVGTVRRARREITRETAANPLEALLAVGLLLPLDDSSVVLPAEVGLVMRGGVVHTADRLHEPPGTGRAVDPTLADSVAAGNAADTIRTIELLLLHLSRSEAHELRAGGVAVRDLRRISDELQVSEHHSTLLLHAADAAGLLGHGERWLPTGAFDTWRRLPGAQRWTAVVRPWLESPRESGPMTENQGRSGQRLLPALAPGRTIKGLARRRQQVLRLLPPHEQGTALSSDSVVAKDRWWHPAASSSRREQSVVWLLQEAEWLGLTGYGALPSWTQLLLDGEDEECRAALAKHLPEPVSHVLLQADLTAVAPGPLDGSVAEMLGTIADTESTGGGSVFRFSADSIRRGLDAGSSAAEILSQLESVSRTDVPQPLRYLINDVSRRHGALRVSVAETIVRSDDPSEIASIVADSSLSFLGLRAVADTVAVSPLPADAVVSALRRSGRSPKAESGGGLATGGLPASPRAHRKPGAAAFDAPPALGEDDARRVVRSMRSADGARHPQSADDPPGLQHTSSTSLIATLRDAVHQGNRLWIGYIDEQGTAGTRLVEPWSVESGRLRAFDRRSDQVRTFALHRITSTAPA